MWSVHLICSGRDCYEEREVIVDGPAELEALVGCDCGHGFLVLSVSEVELVTP
jgi:hypothetical protein